MEKLLFTDNADSSMSGTLANGGTTLVLSASTGSKYPNPGAGEAFIATLFEVNGSSEEEFIEKVKCTARTADTLTIARDVDGAVLAAGGPSSGGYAYPSSPERTVYVQLRWVSLAANEMLTPAVVHAATTKATPVDADELPIIDSAASNVLKKLTWANLKATLFASWGALIAAGTSKATPVDDDVIALGDSAASNATKKLTWANLKATLWSSLGALIAAGTAKTTPVDGDGIAIADSAASSATKYLTLANLWTNLFKGKADALYAVLAKGVTNGDSHDHSGGDGAQIAYSGLSGLPTLGTMAAETASAYAKKSDANIFSASQTLLSESGSNMVLSIFGDGGQANIINRRYTDDTSGCTYTLAKHRGSYATPAAVNSGDICGSFIWQGYGGSNLRSVAAIYGYVDTYTSDTNVSGYLQFSTNGGSTVVTTRAKLKANGDFVLVSSGLLGYDTGAGGTVTQATSRTTGVTINKSNGAITLVSAAGSTTFASFTVTNSLVAATDCIIINQQSGTDLYEIHVTNVAAGSFKVSFRTISGTTTEQPVFNFAVINGATS